MEETTNIKYNRLYGRMCVISACAAMLFISSFYTQTEYPDYYVNMVFLCVMTFELIYGGILVGKNKGFLSYSTDRSNKDRVAGGVFAIVSVLLIGASFVIHGYAAYIIQNILYVSAVAVLAVGLVAIHLRSSDAV